MNNELLLKSSLSIEPLPGFKLVLESLKYPIKWVNGDGYFVVKHINHNELFSVFFTSVLKFSEKQLALLDANKLAQAAMDELQSHLGETLEVRKLVLSLRELKEPTSIAFNGESYTNVYYVGRS